MQERLASKLVAIALSLGVIQPADRELYQFSFHNLLEQLSHWAALLIIGILSGQFVGTLWFIGCFLPLRMYAGGFHERSYIRCFWSSLILYISILLACPWIAMHSTSMVLSFGAITGVVIVFIQAPVADINKPLDTQEMFKYRKISRLIVCAEAAIVFILSVQRSNLWAAYALMGELSAAVLLLIPVPCQYKHKKTL